MLRKFIVAASLAGSLLVPAVAEAAPTTKGAKVTVKRKLRAGDMSAATYVRCYREARNRFYCEWWGLSSQDIYEGNTEGTSGVADVTYYSGRYVARIY